MNHKKNIFSAWLRSLKMQIFYLIFALAVAQSSSSPAPASELQSSRIVNGFQVSIEEVPYHAALKRRGSTGLSYFCGASVISPKAVLTAAHCVSSYQSTPSSLSITVGSSNRSIGGKNHDISRVLTHEAYDADTLVNDIAMLVVVEEISFGQTVDIVPVAPLGFDLPAGTEALVTGYGVTEFGGTASPILLAAKVQITDQATCARAYNSITTIYSGMVCAGASEPPRDACQGDSGGPLVAKGHLVGIVSWGEGCAEEGYPGVYTRISEYESWINQILGLI